MPVITLTSDFGLQNHSLASVKGRILSSFPQCSLIDIAHNLDPLNLQQAAYIFRQAYRFFPPDTFHYLFNDLYADKKQQLLYAYENRQHIFCADNGLMTMIFHDQPAQLYRLLEKPLHYNIISVADLFLGTTATLMHQQPIGLENVPVSDIIVKQPVQAFYSNNILEAHVMYIDHYGNVVLNITRRQFEEVRQGRNFRILFRRDEEINTLSEHYNDVPLSEKLCLFNTAGYLEIAVHKGNAARLFGFDENNERSLFYNTIKLFFE